MTHSLAEPAAQPHARKRRRGLLWVVGTVALITFLCTVVSPWPSSLLIRAVFGAGANATVAEMNKHVPEGSLRERRDVTYSASGAESSFDVFTTASDGEALPTVVWIHGGAWISGAKEDVAPYIQILAHEGFTTVGVNYTIAPEGTYPLALTQLNDTLAHLVSNADSYHIDPERIVIAGDSAGAQLASQLAALITNPDYAELLGIIPALGPTQLAGTVLNCGVYDLDAMARLTGIGAWGLKTSLWAYTGTRNWAETYAGSTMSTETFVTADFPPTFITGGNGDALTWIQTVPMVEKLKSEGVAVTPLLWAADHSPALPHEYQFHLDLPEAQEALAQTIDFLTEVTKQ